MRANLPSYEVGLYEQNALTFLMYTQPELLDNAVFDISSYGLNCWCVPSGLSSTKLCKAQKSFWVPNIITEGSFDVCLAWTSHKRISCMDPPTTAMP